MTDDRMDALRFAIDHQPPKKVGWWKRTGILIGILLYLVTAVVAFVVAIVAAALALLPLLTLLAMGLYLKVGSDRMRKLMTPDNTKNLPPDFVARVDRPYARAASGGEAPQN